MRALSLRSCEVEWNGMDQFIHELVDGYRVWVSLRMYVPKYSYACHRPLCLTCSSDDLRTGHPVE